MRASPPRARILGTGRYLPARVVANDEIAARAGTSDAWLKEHVGVERRHVAAEGETTSDMATAAARAALDAAGLSPADLDLIIVATGSGDSPMPATAATVQQKLGTELVPSFDLAASHAGFLYALAVAEQSISAGATRTALVVGADMLSRRVDPEDRTTAALFGDGAGAVILGAAGDDGRGILSMRLGADGTMASLLSIPGGGTGEPMTLERLAAKRNKVQMEGPDLFQVSVKKLQVASMEALKAAGLLSDKLDWVIPQQANRRIVDRIAERLGYSRSKFIENLADVGNTGAASIPIALDEAVRDGRVKPGQNVLLCALGAGITWAASMVRM
ncbi:beta-ketoacyl-ACP synthase III [Polyangium mundeleinium]|uniref:Beta-ketoacyl-[acyl-carrier-protein] synthase III n=1 Tax=Polyangium mundeleinium TaxID=2995306 RepID=A0ABT5EPJ4_9BACT|nr:beta-ketoacyl-ACP synthase III [Polyangium mundeleinium]MDC0743676.1 ketoacyl-ACP synthase III [Polyangium mundeleinium]